MKSPLLWIIPICAFMIGFIVCLNECQSQELVAAEESYLDLLNWVRTDPLPALRFIKQDDEWISSTFHQITDKNLDGIGSLLMSQDLNKVAEIEKNKIISADPFNKVKTDLSVLMSRIEDAGYCALKAEETTGLVVFNNFMGPDRALKLMLRQMIQGELSSGNQGERYIFNPIYNEVGIAFGTDSTQIGGNSVNFYLGVFIFSTKCHSVYEKALLEMINWAREDPMRTAKDLGIPTDSVDLELYQKINERVLPQLRANPYLKVTSEKMALDMLNRNYYDAVSPEGLTTFERIVMNGYHPADSGVAYRMIVSTDYMPAAEASCKLFKSLYKREWSVSKTHCKLNFLNSAFDEIGISFVFIEPNGSSENIELPSILNNYYVYMLVCIFATPITV